LISDDLAAHTLGGYLCGSSDVLGWTSAIPVINMPPATNFENVHVYAYGDGDEHDHGWGCSYR